jgi:ribosomal protein S14
LEAETVSSASKACSECWSVAGTWRGFEECREGVREVAGKLKKILDETGRTYKGERVYAP